RVTMKPAMMPATASTATIAITTPMTGASLRGCADRTHAPYAQSRRADLSARSLRRDGEDDGRGVSGVVMHGIVRLHECGGRADRLATARVARVQRVGATGDLDAEAMAGGEAVRRGPELDAHGLLEIARSEAAESIADVRRHAGGVDITEAHE